MKDKISLLPRDLCIRIATDMGKYGSATLHLKGTEEVNLTSRLLRATGGSMVKDVRSPRQSAFSVLALARWADVILEVGGGGFSGLLKDLYFEHAEHPIHFQSLGCGSVKVKIEDRRVAAALPSALLHFHLAKAKLPNHVWLCIPAVLGVLLAFYRRGCRCCAKVGSEYVAVDECLGVASSPIELQNALR
mmetsp:Transcript_94172/g.202134  ORF Transcript_94172/g.202134 Transcript_94172/m.202134 type:complete len:190 (+) Transcript_94172:3-572(+)